MTDKHLAVSLEHQVKQSRTIKRLEKEVQRQKSKLDPLKELVLELYLSIHVSQYHQQSRQVQRLWSAGQQEFISRTERKRQ